MQGFVRLIFTYEEYQRYTCHCISTSRIYC